MNGQLYLQHARQTQLLDLLPAGTCTPQHSRGVGELVAGKAAAMGSPRLMVFGRLRSVLQQHSGPWRLSWQRACG